MTIDHIESVFKECQGAFIDPAFLDSFYLRFGKKVFNNLDTVFRFQALVTFYFLTNPSKNVLASTDILKRRIGINYNWANTHPVNEIKGVIFHEMCHIAGYTHRGNWIGWPWVRNSIPYQVGYFVRDFYKKEDGGRYMTDADLIHEIPV